VAIISWTDVLAGTDNMTCWSGEAVGTDNYGTAAILEGHAGRQTGEQQAKNGLHRGVREARGMIQQEKMLGKGAGGSQL
jgi:hypothetical protein